jgi:hypothetical protein
MQANARSTENQLNPRDYGVDEETDCLLLSLPFRNSAESVSVLRLLIPAMTRQSG